MADLDVDRLKKMSSRGEVERVDVILMAMALVGFIFVGLGLETMDIPVPVATNIMAAVLATPIHHGSSQSTQNPPPNQI